MAPLPPGLEDLRHMSFFVIFIVIYSSVLAPILIQIAYTVHRHTQFKMIVKQSYSAVHSSS